MQTISIQKRSITKLSADIIVNAANERLMQGGGVCGYIFQAAGAKKLQEACNEIGHCPTGSAVITPGFDLCRYIVHAVGPVWHGGDHHEPQLLYEAYKKSLDLAKEKNCHSIGFPLISAGLFGYPSDKAWRKAIQAVHDWFEDNKDYDIDVVFAVIDDKILDQGRDTAIEIMRAYYRVSRSDWMRFDMPDKRDHFILNRPFTKEQIDVLRMGHIPQEMEDKWFWYMEGKKLYLHRSWTGFCIYIIELKDDGNHSVTVSRDPEQFSSTDIDNDRENLNTLLDFMVLPSYDYYHQWLDETAKTLEKQQQ